MCDPSLRVDLLLTFAISAQLLPASRIVFSLCSSAAVQGVFVRLFLAGGPIGKSVMLGSPAGRGTAELDGADIGRGVGPEPDARRFLGTPVGDEVASSFPGGSAVEDWACEDDTAVDGSSSG